MTVVVLTVFTVGAFAANSLLCRMALGGHLVDPVSFAAIRLVSGALALIPIGRLAGEAGALQLVSGVITSGLGYVLWYVTLPRLTTTQASMVQLVMPVLVALGGVALLGEQVTARLVMASALILGGVASAVLRSAAPRAQDRV